MSTLNVKKISGLATALVAALAFSHGAAQAESTYGYFSTPASGVAGATVIATARLNIAVSIPKLILLRVGTSGSTVDTVTLTGALNPGIPGGIAAAAVATNGNNDSLATGWNDAAPVFTAASGTPVTAASWTNSAGGGSLSCAVTTAFIGASGLLDTHITVASGTPLAGGSLAHPGADTSCAGPATTFARNTVVGSTWTYSITAAGLAAAEAGVNTETLTYTATSI